MTEKTKLEELAGELPERERQELLDKITRRIRLDEPKEIVRVQIKESERDRLIRDEMPRVSWWVRFLLWFQGVVTGRTRRDLYLRRKLSGLKRHVRRISPGIAGMDTRDLTPRFAQRLFDLYSAAHPLIGLMRSFHFQNEFHQGSIAYLVESRYPDCRTRLEELMPLEEMEAVLDRTGSEEELRRLLLRRFGEYLKEIPDQFFSQLDDGIRPLYYLRNLVLFPFSALFRHFNYTAGDNHLDEKYPVFRRAPVMQMLDQLERLYYGIDLALRLEKSGTIHEEILWYYCLRERHLEEGSDELTRQVAGLTRLPAALVRAAEEFHRRVPVMDLIRYFRQDPYYRLMFNVPRYSLKTFYITGARASFTAQLEEQLRRVKEKVIDRKIGKLFGASRLVELQHYARDPETESARRDLPVFAHTKSLCLFYNFLLQFYQGGIQEALRLALIHLLPNNRIAQTRLMQFASGLGEMEARIARFDRGLSPEEEDGKALRRYRNLRPGDLDDLKMFRSFTAAKKREALDLLRKGGEDLRGIRQAFADLLASPAESVKSLLKTTHFYRGKSDTLQQILKGNVDLVTDFTNLMDQLLVVEKGS